MRSIGVERLLNIEGGGGGQGSEYCGGGGQDGVGGKPFVGC